MRTIRTKYILIGIGLTLFAITVLIILYPKYAELKANLTKEFELAVKGASMTFVESVTNHTALLEQNFSEAINNLQRDLIAQADELDGYLSRISYGESDVASEVSLIFEIAYKKNISPAFAEFKEIYEEEIRKLEDGLLLELDDSLSLFSLQSESVELQQYASRVTSVLRSKQGLALKVLDDSFEWVPIAGDVWGFAKIVYDPRKEAVENKIEEITQALYEHLNRKIMKSIATSIPMANHVEEICRDSFDDNFAVRKYIYLTIMKR